MSEIIKTIDEIYERAWRTILSKEEVEEYDNTPEEDREESSIYVLVQAYRLWQSKTTDELKHDSKKLVAHLQLKLAREFNVYSGMLKQYVDKAKSGDNDDSFEGLLEAELMENFVQKIKMIQFIQAELKALKL